MAGGLLRWQAGVIVLIAAVLSGCGGKASSSTASPSAFYATPSTLIFEQNTTIGQSATQNVTLVNRNSVPIVIKSVTISPAQGFALQPSLIGITLPPSGSIPLRIRFKPVLPSVYTGTLKILGLALAPSWMMSSGNQQQPVGDRNATLRIPVQTAVTLAGHGASVSNRKPHSNIRVDVSPVSVTIQANSSQQFVASVTGTPTTSVVWSARLGSIDSEGHYTAPKVSSISPDVVTAVSVADQKAYGSSSVTITPITTAAVSVSPKTVTIQANSSQQFVASVRGTTTTSVVWSARLGSIDSDGRYTAPKVSSITPDVVTAVSVADQTAYGSSNVTITPISAASEYWVSTSGSDSNDGSQIHPWASIAHADSVLVPETGGAIVHVACGRYNIPNASMTTSRNGTATQRITYISDSPSTYCAELNTFWAARGNYVDIIGFDIHNDVWGGALDIGYSGTTTTSVGGLYDRVMHNRFHDTGVTCAVHPHGGLVDIGHSTFGVIFDSNIVNNTGVPGGCPGEAGTTNHGLYVEGYHNTIRNNLISNTAGAGVNMYHNPCQNVVANNTIFHTYDTGILMGGDADGLPPCASTGNDYTSINNNLLIRNGYGCNSWNGLAGSNALSDSAIYFSSSYNGAHDIVANNYVYGASPGCPNPTAIIVAGGSTPIESGNIIVNTGGSSSPVNLVLNYQDNGPYSSLLSGATGDYHLVSDSPAVDKGTAGWCATLPGINPCAANSDFDGLARPSGVAYDIGAYELQ